MGDVCPSDGTKLLFIFSIFFSEYDEDEEKVYIFSYIQREGEDFNLK